MYNVYILGLGVLHRKEQRPINGQGGLDCSFFLLYRTGCVFNGLSSHQNENIKNRRTDLSVLKVTFEQKQSSKEIFDSDTFP